MAPNEKNTADCKLWDRQQDEAGSLEPNRWYSRFEIYRRMGPDRSLLGACNIWRVRKGTKKYNAVPGAWTNAFTKWNWKVRAEAWDAHEKAEQDALWKSRRQQVKDQDFDQAQTLRDKVDEFLEVLSSFKRRSETEEIDEQGNVVRVITIALNTSITQIASALKTASDLQRLAAEMLPPTQRIEHGSDPERPIKVDLSSLPDDILRAIDKGEES